MSPSRLTATELLSVLQPWRDVAENIHRRVLQLADADDRTETLWIGCGSGRSVLWWAERVGCPIQGVDPDPDAIEAAERATLTVGLGRYITLQHADPADLPHREAVFDLAVIRMLQCGDAPGEVVLAQAARVVRKGGTVMALVPTWFNPPSEDDAERVARLGIHPWTLMEWKGAARDAGLVDLAAEEVAPDGAWLAHGLFGMLLRAWRLARWRGVTAVLSGDFAAVRRLAATRRLGLSLIKGSRWPHDDA